MADCPACGHPEVAHELVTREGKTWFSVEGSVEQIDQARSEGRLFSWCGHCDDGCPELAGAEQTGGEVNG